MHDLVLITLNWLFKNLGRHSHPSSLCRCGWQGLPGVTDVLEGQDESINLLAGDRVEHGRHHAVHEQWFEMWFGLNNVFSLV